MGQFGLLGFLNIGHSIFLAINFPVDLCENCATIAITSGKKFEIKLFYVDLQNRLHFVIYCVIFEQIDTIFCMGNYMGVVEWIY